MERISIRDRVYQPRSQFPTLSYTHWSIQVMKYTYQENSSRSSTIKTGTQSYTLVVVCDDDTDLQTYMPCHVFNRGSRGDPYTRVVLYFWPVSCFV